MAESTQTKPSYDMERLLDLLEFVPVRPPLCPHCQRKMIKVSAPNESASWRCIQRNPRTGKWCGYRIDEVRHGNCF